MNYQIKQTLRSEQYIKHNLKLNYPQNIIEGENTICKAFSVQNV